MTAGNIQDKNLQRYKKLGLTTGSNSGNNWYKTQVESLGIPTHHVKDDDTILQFLENKRADIVIDSPVSLRPRTTSIGLQDKIVETNIEFDEVWFYVLLGRDSTYAPHWDKLNNAITETVNSIEFKTLMTMSFN